MYRVWLDYRARPNCPRQDLCYGEICVAPDVCYRPNVAEDLELWKRLLDEMCPEEWSEEA